MYYQRLIEKEIGLKLRTSGDVVVAGPKSLKTLRNKIAEKSDEKEPDFLVVLTVIGGAYQREDGIYVVPINLLKP